MNKREFLKTLGLGAVAGTAGALAGNTFQAAPESNTRKETSFERIQRTGKIRCAYIIAEPVTVVDPLTNRMSGIFYDYANLLAEYCGFQAEWVEEVGWNNFVTGLNADRYDLVVATIWPNAQRAVHGALTQPLFYTPVYPYVRSDENRFSTVSDLNIDSVTFSVIDNDPTDITAREEFPNAKRLAVPNNASTSQLLMDVVTGKADVTLEAPFYTEQFLEHNPGLLKKLPGAAPVRVFGNALMFHNDDWRLKEMMDMVFVELSAARIMEKLIDKYTGRPDLFLLPDEPYKLPQ